MDFAETRPLDKYKRHSIDVVVDRFIVRHGGGADSEATEPGGEPEVERPDAARLADSVETALRLGEGVVLIAPVPRDGEQAPEFEERRYSEQLQLSIRRHDRR
jgi:excinuclease ABC subunit A